ncbi:hypothetical protein Tco_1418110 [Tanacetum coccineum]
MTDYSLWEVILNGNKVLKRTVGEVEQEYEPTSAEEKQDRRNEMKARGTLMIGLPKIPRRFIKRTGRKLDVNGQRVGFDSKIGMLQFDIKNGPLQANVRLPRNQEKRGKMEIKEEVDLVKQLQKMPWLTQYEN